MIGDVLFKIITACIVITAIVVFSMIVFPFPQAWSHSAPSGWSYPPECCGGSDCSPIPESAVKLLPDGSYMVLSTQEIFISPTAPSHPPLRPFRWSKDQSFHRCSATYGNNYTYCLFVPQPGV